MISKPRLELCPLPPKIGWTGKWIWVDKSIGYAFRNSYAFFRKKFSGAGNIRIDISADTRCELYLDGCRIARGTASSYPAYKTYDTYTADVQEGEHVVGVLVHHIGEECATAVKSRPGLLVEIKVGDLTVASDSTWEAAPGVCYEQDIPQMMSHFGFYQVCDCERVPQGWTEVLFDDSNWSCAEVIGEVGCEPWVYLVPRDVPHLGTVVHDAVTVVNRGVIKECRTSQGSSGTTVAEEMAGRERIVTDSTLAAFPIQLGVDRSEFITVDFGREVTGHLRLIVNSASRGQQLDVGYDEVLDSNGLPNPRRTYVHFADRFYLREGVQEVEVFDGRGFHYLMIDVPVGKGGIRLEGVQVDERTYPVPGYATFKCSDKSLEKLYQVGLETTRLCMLDTYVDCPSRERVLWMDSYLEGVCSSYGMGVTDLWRRALYLFAQDTCSTGNLAGAVKGFALTDRELIVQSYMMYYVFSLSDYVLHSGDLLAGEMLFDVAAKQLDIVESFVNSDGLIDNHEWGGWQFLDWSAMDFSGVSASVNAIYLVMLRKMARLAHAIGRTSIANELHAKREKLVRTFRHTFWRPDEGLFVDAIRNGEDSGVRSQLTCALAIWAGVVSDDEAREIIRRVTDKESLLAATPGDYRLSPDFKCQTGGIVPIGTPALGTILALVMFEHGMEREAIRYLNEKWSPLAANGTFAEHFVTDTNTSFCHGWSAAPVFLLPRYILGVRPLAPSWAEVEINPHPGNLKWAEGTVPTPFGDIKVAWKDVNGTIEITTSLPEGIKERKVARGFGEESRQWQAELDPSRAV